jgi:serpin B
MSMLTRRRFLTLSGSLLAPSALGCNLISKLNPMIESSTLVAGNTAFALDLFAQLRTEKGNLFLSPFSISTALAMTSAGAKGATLDEMQKVLHLPADPHPAFGELIARFNGTSPTEKRTYQLTTANAIWAQKGYPWRPEFTDLTRKDYGSGLMQTDFGMPEVARQAINAWVEKETHEKIRDLIPAGVIDALTRMVLTNAVYFKGSWAAPFKTEQTKDQPFYLADGMKAEVPLMFQTGRFEYGEFTPTSDNPAQILELPYTSKELSMLVLLPSAGKLAELEDRLSASTLADWTKEMHPIRLEVFLPRFKTEKAVTLKGPLQALGMKEAFSDNAADFSGMHTGSEKLFISAVLHKAFVDVNEEGTEAAAATGVVMKTRAVQAQPKVFRADRPFLFLIRDNATGSILFLGRFSNPKG